MAVMGCTGLVGAGGWAPDVGGLWIASSQRLMDNVGAGAASSRGLKGTRQCGEGGEGVWGEHIGEEEGCSIAAVCLRRC
jgi:hypothetical protein